MDRWSKDEYTDWLNSGTPLNENVSQIALGFMDITELPDRIDNLSNLEVIVCPSTITAIPSSVAKLKNLKWLNISTSPISTLPDELRNFKQNIKIIVEDTPLWRNPPQQLQTWPSNITFVPPLFGKPRINSIKKRLTDLIRFTYKDYLDWIYIGSPINKYALGLELDQNDLSSVRITSEIIEKIGNFKSLDNLYIIDADITELPSTIVNLTKLWELKIINTPLKTLPSDIGKLKNLVFLNLEDSDIETLPNSIGKLKNLRGLNLINTKLEILPPVIGQLDKLDTLNLDYTNITILPEELKNILGYMPINITINETPMAFNTEYGLQLRSWPSKFVIEPLPPEQSTPPQQLATIRSQVNPYVKAKDIIGVNDDESAKELLNQGYKIFMCRELYYATSLDSLSGYINDTDNEYYICNRSADGRFQRTDVNTPLISINIITGFQGFVEKEQLLMALNSQNNYFSITEKGENVVVIKGRPDPHLYEICKEANAKKYDIKVIDVIERDELMSKLKMKTDFSDVFKDIESDNDNDNEEVYRNTFKDIESDNEEVYRNTFKDVNSDNAGGGRTRRVKRINKRRSVKRRSNKKKTNKRRTNKRKTKKR